MQVLRKGGQLWFVIFCVDLFIRIGVNLCADVFSRTDNIFLWRVYPDSFNSFTYLCHF